MFVRRFVKSEIRFVGDQDLNLVRTFVFIDRFDFQHVPQSKWIF